MDARRIDLFYDEAIQRPRGDVSCSLLAVAAVQVGGRLSLQDAGGVRLSGERAQESRGQQREPEQELGNHGLSFH